MRRSAALARLEAVAGVEQDLVDLVRVAAPAGVAPTYAARRLAELAGDVGTDAADDGVVVEDAADDRAEGGEAPGGDLHADGVAHDVLEAVGLVEHHDVVVGEQRAAAGDVRP